MAYVDYGDNSGYQQPDVLNDPGPQGGRMNYTDPPVQSGGADPYSTVAGFYQNLLGRPPESNDAAMGWWNGMGGNVANIYNGIYGSDEATARRAAAANPAPSAQTPQAPQAPSGGGRTTDRNEIAAFVSQLAGMPGADPSLGKDPNYWVGRIIETGGLGSDNRQFWQNAGVGPTAFINNPNREQGGGAAAPNPYAATGGNPGGYTDPSSQLYLSQLLQRLQQVQQPQDNSIFELLKSLATQQATKLQQAPYTPADDAALITQYRQPLTQARDTAKQQAALDLSRRGITPTSGVYQDRMKQIDQAYVGGVAQGANQMGVNAVQQKNTNAMQSLQILSSLMGAQNQVVDRGNAMKNQAVDLARMFPEFDAARLDQLLRASGDNSSSSALQSLMSLGNMNLNTLGMNNANDSANSAAWGKLIASILGGI